MKRKNRTIHSQSPATAAAQPHPEYGKTLLGLSEFRYDTSNGEEHDQLVALLDRCVNSSYSLAESCWIAAQPDAMAGVTYGLLGKDAEDFAKLSLVYLRRGWLAEFITGVLSAYQRWNGNVTPEDLLGMLAEKHNEFMSSLGDARRILRNHPESVQDEVRKAAAALPDTHQSADQDQCGAA